MLPALRQAFNASPDDDRLDRLFGPWPRLTILAATAVGLLFGYGLQDALEQFTVFRYIHVPAVLFAVAYALLYRHYLFNDPTAGEDDFPWLAAALIPPAAAMVLVSFLAQAVNGFGTLPAAPGWTVIGAVLDAFADSLSVAAGLTIAVAALCYSKAWREAVKALVRRLIAFKVMVWVMVLVFVEIGFVGPIVARMIEGIFGVDIPDWLGDFVDQLTYAALMTTIYVAIIGGTWTACRRSFGQLLEDGEVDVLLALSTMAESPEKRRREARKARAKAEAEAEAEAVRQAEDAPPD